VGDLLRELQSLDNFVRLWRKVRSVVSLEMPLFGFNAILQFNFLLDSVLLDSVIFEIASTLTKSAFADSRES
jgi:hypothetical protein